MTVITLLGGTLRVPARDTEVRTARRWLHSLLDDLLSDQATPVADDVVLATSEVLTNALKHSDSSALGSEISVTALVMDRSAIRIEVRDSGSTRRRPTLHKLSTTACHGRGLRIVAELSAGRWGTCLHDGSGHRTVWRGNA